MCNKKHSLKSLKSFMILEPKSRASNYLDSVPIVNVNSLPLFAKLEKTFSSLLTKVRQKSLRPREISVLPV